MGYGDYYVRTNIGRLIAFLICIWGVFLVSMMVIVLSSLLHMNVFETKSFTVVQRLLYRKKLRKAAAFLITSFIKNRLL